MASSRPNILFLMTDQQARQAQSAAGNPWVRTPHLDALSTSGVRFTRAYCAAPVCSPSRSSLLTGRMPHQTGVIVNGLEKRERDYNLCQIFHDAGYDIGWSGNWIRPEPHPAYNPQEPQFEPLLPEDFHPRLGVDGDERRADVAIEYLRRPHERPFLLGVSLCNPHDICFWTMGQAQSVALDGELPPLPDNFEIDSDEPDFIRRCRRRTHYGQENTFTQNWDEEKWRIYLREYYRLTERSDREIGRIMKALHDCNLERETLVLFTSDHGEGMAAHHWVVKLMLYENPVSVPLTLSWPGMLPNDVVDRSHLVSGVDMMPTLCDYAGIPAPAGIIGQSLRPVIEDPANPGRPFVVSELHPDTEDLDMAARMLRTAQYKYVAFSMGRNRELLFDMERDPGETRNLAGNPRYTTQLHAHRQWLSDWIRETGDTFSMPA